MPGRRLNARGFALSSYVGRGLVVAFAAALIWYGTMLILLTLNVDAAAINGLCGYRDAYNYFAQLTPTDITTSTRLTMGLSGMLAALALGYLASRELPRAHPGGTAVVLQSHGRGITDIQPRAIERAIEIAALAHPAVTGVRARYGNDKVELAITARDAATIAQTLRDVRRRAHDSLAAHDLAGVAISVTLAAFDRLTRRELA